MSCPYKKKIDTFVPNYHRNWRYGDWRYGNWRYRNRYYPQYDPVVIQAQTPVVVSNQTPQSNMFDDAVKNPVFIIGSVFCTFLIIVMMIMYNRR
jgi:hypothetical protein